MESTGQLGRWAASVYVRYNKRVNADVYITGPNVYFMSGELVTLLSGRYVELKMLPPSFAEYVSAFPSTMSQDELYRDYVYNSSFPYTVGLKSRKHIHTYLELVRRGYQVHVGKAGSAEVDFVTRNCDGNLEYYQVALTVQEETTLARELGPLDAIPDHNPKYLLVMDNDPQTSYNGIRQKYALDWLLEK